MLAWWRRRPPRGAPTSLLMPFLRAREVGSDSYERLNADETLSAIDARGTCSPLEIVKKLGSRLNAGNE